MNRLFFRLFNAGLSNCRMSLDIGIGLAHLTGRTLVPYDVKPPWNNDPLLFEGRDYFERATVLDLYELPVPFERTHATEAEINLLDATGLLRGPVRDSVIRFEPGAPIEEDDFWLFRNGREHVLSLGEELFDQRDLVVDVDTLGMYSYFFYVRGSMEPDLRTVLARVRPRRPYRDLADRIATSLSRFNAVHIRRGDFIDSRLSPRAHLVTGDEILSNLTSRFSANDRLVVCTDSSSEEEIFQPISNHFREIVFLDKLLLGSDWRSELLALPFHDDSVLGLVTQLVAAKAECFVGTLFSTFTALIQRSRGFCNGKPEFLFCYCDWDPELVRFERCEFLPVQDGPYSWNRILYPVTPSVASWFREWPEFYQSTPPLIPPEEYRDEIVMLRPSEARVHGHTARHERWGTHENIGYWTDQHDYVTWDIFVATHSFFRVEIRYACPEECAGSTYALEVESGRMVKGTVANTGGWTLFSSWQILGTLEIPPGQHILAVKILKMAASAAMNLAGVRLVSLKL